MRSRFLNIDLFNCEPPPPPSPSSSSSSHALTFLNLPVPQFPLNLSPSPYQQDFLRFDSLSGIDLSLELESLRIGSALSDFLAEVIPQPVGIEDEGCGNGRVEREAGILAEEKERFKSCSTAEHETGDDNFPKLQITAENVTEKRGAEAIVLFQFETPELDICLGSSQFSGKEAEDILSSVLEIESNADADAASLSCPVSYILEAEQALLDFGDTTSHYFIEPKDVCLTDNEESPLEIKGCQFPLLEVEEINLEFVTSMSMDYEFAMLLRKVEPPFLSQKDYFTLDTEEISNFLKHKLLQFQSDHSLLKQCLDSDGISLETLLKVDFVSCSNTSYLLVYSSSSQVSIDGDSFQSVSPLVLEDFQILDMEAALFSEVFNNQKVLEPDFCQEMLLEDLPRSYDEVINSSELALIDDMFKSLPVPVLPDSVTVRPLSAIAEEALIDLKPQPALASDGIYLNWHLLEEESFGFSTCSSYQKMLEVVNMESIDFDLNPAGDGKIILDFILHDDASLRPKTEESKGQLNIFTDGVFMQNEHLRGASSESFFGAEYQKPASQTVLSEFDSKRASLLFKSMSPFNDLDFFLNPSNKKAYKDGLSAVQHPDEIKYVNAIEIPGEVNNDAPIINSWDTHLTSEVHNQAWNVKLHKVKLSEDILLISESLKRSYMDVLGREPELKKTYSFLPDAVDSNSLLRIPKQVLMEHLRNANAHRSTLLKADGVDIAFATLCAIKQTAWYICFYGIHSGCLYLDYLCKEFDGFTSRLGALWQLVMDADSKTDLEKVRSHPSLSIIQELLCRNKTQNGLRALILTDRIFWSSLKSLLTTMHLSFEELNEAEKGLIAVHEINDFSTTSTDEVLHKDCLLAFHEQISASFPYHKFGIILEYGGALNSSRISGSSPNSFPLPCLHFLKVELDAASASKALCEGVHMPQDTKLTLVGNPPINAPDKHMNLQKLEKLLNFVPFEDIIGTTNITKLGRVSFPPCSEPPSVGLENSWSTAVPFLDSIIVVNTQSSSDVMLMSRRSTYQKILSMEKEGIQVLERDSTLPVDVIVSAAVCLVWYNCKNIAEKASGSTEGASLLPYHVDNIATNVLTTLSYAFRVCILIFEGQIDFLATVMESSDGLYAAAAGLGIDLQLFCSYSPELTDEIILNCIASETQSTRGLYSKFPEAETLAESFLTKFPSVNPLSAHAILSSGEKLIDFFEWSHECRVSAIRKYHVPEESISLFSVLCRQGEQEDSQSIMTDSSSSVSSGPDSNYRHIKCDPGRRTCIYAEKPHKVEIVADDTVQFQPQKCRIDSSVKFHGLSELYDSSQSHRQGILKDYKEPRPSLGVCFGQKGGIGVSVIADPSRVRNPFDSKIGEGSNSPDVIEHQKPTFDDGFFHRNLGAYMATTDSFNWADTTNSDIADKETERDAANLNNSSIRNSSKFSFLMPFLEEHASGESNSGSKVSLIQRSYPTFPTLAEIESASSARSPMHKKIDGFFSEDLTDDKEPSNERKKFLKGEFGLRSTSDSQDIPSQVETPTFGGTPLKNAICSSYLQKGSPWTTEFLNKIREKSKLRQQSLPSSASPCYNGLARSTSNSTKRRSPSVLELFKYQAGSIVRRTPEGKRQRRSAQSRGSPKNGNPSSSLIPSWTPADKRARRMLSFATNEHGSQTKLVWSDRRP